MSATPSNQQPEITTWLAYSFRLTSFLSPAATIDSANLWEDIVGSAAVSEQRSPRIGQTLIVGPSDTGKLILEIQPGRIDWRFSVAQDSMVPVTLPGPTSPDELKPIGPSLEHFLEVADRWLKRSPATVRLAFGAQLRLPVADRLTGYKELSMYLHSVQVNPEWSSDLVYQINRPRISNVIPELRVNRLSKWAVTIITTVPLTVTGNNSALGAPPDLFFTKSLDLDINTAAERRDNLPTDTLAAQFHELSDLGLEIARDGDIP